MDQEPISCCLGMRQLDVQVHHLDMMLVHRRDLPSIQPLLLGAKQGDIRYHCHSLWYGLDQTPTSQSQGRLSKHKTTPAGMENSFLSHWHECARLPDVGCVQNDTG